MPKTINRPLIIGAAVLFLAFSAFAWFSFSLTAPNLILSSWDPYWNWQLWMWKTFFNNRQLLTYAYAGVVTLCWLGWGLLMWLARHSTLTAKKVLMVAGLTLIPLLFSVNALSYDVFNYIFNAKMVAVFHTNPHVKVALDFAYDDWTRFMHNTHTPAPYGYGWTGLSVLPFLAGGGKFLPTWLLFRGMSVLSWLGLWGVYAWLDKKGVKISWWWALAVLCLPLMALEIISTDHNDLWMMAPAVLSLGIMQKAKPRSWLMVAGSALLLLFSMSIKFATLTLVPLWLVLGWKWGSGGVGEWVKKYWADIAAFLLFLPLLTSRSQQFHPWYLTWCLAWLPWMRIKAWKWSLVALAIASTARYLPYLWFGSFEGNVLQMQKMITWGGFAAFWVVWGCFAGSRRLLSKNRVQ